MGSIKSFVTSIKSETEVKGKLVKYLKQELRNAVIFRHEDKYSAGIPDISLTDNGFTLWIEVKHVTPKKPFKSTGLQTHTAQRLENRGRCVFVIFEETKEEHQLTVIMFPKFIDKFNTGKMIIQGFDFQFILDFIKNTMQKGTGWIL
jgi:hypothetical protein